MPVNNKEVEALSALEFKARQVVEGFLTGMHKSPFHGYSVEFAEHRAYNPGESTRHIDWKLFARTDRAYIKRYEEETNLRCHLVLDTSSSMYYPALAPHDTEGMNKVRFATYAAAALTQLMRKQRDAVGLTLFSGTVEVDEAAKGNAAHIKRVMAHLEKVLGEQAPTHGRRTDIVQALHHIAVRAPRRSLVVILSDMMEGAEADEAALFDALQHLRFNKHDIILFHVVDRQVELELAVKDRPYTFVDMENGARVKAHPAQVRAAYREAVAAHWQRLRLKCAQYKIDLVAADIHKGFTPVLLEFFLKRSRIR
jgi:uncharacterized protein (DUF58 family)